MTNKCECGCGRTPKGNRSRFLPGHDAKLKSKLTQAAETATAELRRRHWIKEEART